MFRFLLRKFTSVRFNGLKFIWAIIFCFSLSNSNAQSLFFHLLPGFVPAFTWVGLGADANWTTIGNWSTGVVPGPSDVAKFDSSCVSNCNPNMNAVISVSGLQLKSSYAGTISQGAGISIAIGAGGWTQESGVFVGSDANINLNGNFNQSGGTFTATNAITTFSADFAKTGGMYNANSGQTVFNANQTIVPGNVVFNALSFVGMVTHNLSGGTLTAGGSLTIDSPSGCCGAVLNNGTIEAKGNVDVLNFGKAGTALISLSGTGNQTISGVATASLPSLQIASTGGTVTVAGQINIRGNYAWLSGAVDLTGSTVRFLSDAMVNVIPGTLNYNHVTFAIPNTVGAGQNLNSGTMTVNGTLNIDGEASCCEGGINNGTILARGNVNFLNNGLGGTALITVGGSSSQTVAGVSTAKTPSLRIASSGGTVTLSGTLFVTGNYTYTSGTVSATGSTLDFFTNGTQTIFAGPVNYNNVLFRVNGIATQDLGGSTMNVGGVLTIDSTAGCCEGGLNNGTIQASGNVSFLNRGRNGSALLNYVGTANTTLTVGASAQTLDTTHVVSKTGAGKVSLVATTNFSSTGRNFSISSGTFDLAGFNFSVNSSLTISINGILLCNGGTATAGTWSIAGQISCGTGQGITWTGSAGDNLWSTASNWTNNTIPVATDVALFNNSVCIAGTCNAQINSNLSVRGISLQSTYPGTLTQNAGRTLTIGTAGYTHAGGTFTGGDATVTMNGPFALTSGSYTATSGSWTHTGNFSFSGAPTFNHNGGTWIQSGNAQVFQFSGSNIVFHNFTLGGYAVRMQMNGSNIAVEGDLVLSDTHFTGEVSSGTIQAQGDISVTNLGKNGSAVILINGSGIQSLNSVSGNVPSITINKVSGTLNLTGSITTSSNWTHLAGTVAVGTSSLLFMNGVGVGTQQVIPGTMEYNNVTFGGYAATQNLNSGTMIINGLVTFSDTYFGSNNVTNGFISARGNISVINHGKNGNAVLLIEGAGAQTLNSTSGQLPSIQISKLSGTLNLVGTISTQYNWTHTTGAVDAGASTLHFNNGVGVETQTITPGTVNYNNVTFGGYAATQNLNGGTMIVDGDVLFTDTYNGSNAVNNGTILARGDLTLTANGKGGTAMVIIEGTAAQSFTGTEFND